MSIYMMHRNGVGRLTCRIAFDSWILLFRPRPRTLPSADTRAAPICGILLGQQADLLATIGAPPQNP